MYRLIEGFNDNRLINGHLLRLLCVEPLNNAFQISCPVDLAFHAERHCLFNYFNRVLADKFFYNQKLIPDIPGLIFSYQLTILHY